MDNDDDNAEEDEDNFHAKHSSSDEDNEISNDENLEAAVDDNWGWHPIPAIQLLW